jgi:hypothetical protein
MRALLLAAGLVASGTAAAQDGQTRIDPHLATEVDLGLYGVSTVAAPDAERRGTSAYLFGEVAAGLHLAPGLSIQGVLAFEPIGEGDSTGGMPGEGLTGFRRQSAFLEALFLEWRPREGTMLQAGRFVAPFGRGHHDFPGILTRVRAHEVSMIGDSLGIGGSLTLLSDPTLGEHDVSAAVFTLDRSPLSSTLLTRRRCCDERYERFSRNTAAQGGPGNTAQFENVALALDGDGIAALPGFSYHLGLVSRGAGQDGTAREWGYAAALRYQYRWTAEQSTLLFAEAVQFRNAGGKPIEEIDGGGEAAVTERRTFTTLGVQHRHGPWRGTLAWQRDERRRDIAPLPTESYLEASVGREIGGGLAVDVGYQYGRYLREETGGLGTSHAILLRLGWTTH